MTKVIAITAAAAMIATGASAGSYSKTAPATAEPVIQQPAAPVAAPRFDWTGAYAGAALGFGRLTTSAGERGTSAAGGFFGGYRWDMGDVVVGAEAQLAPMAFGSPTLASGDRLRAGAALLLSAGTPVTADGRTLAYAGAGPAMLRTSGPAGSETSTGLTGQLGVDHMLTDTIMLRGSVSYTAINGVGSANDRTRTLGAGVGLAFRF